MLSQSSEVSQQTRKIKFSRKPSKKGTKGTQLLSPQKSTANSILAKTQPAPRLWIGLKRIESKIRGGLEMFFIFHKQVESSKEKNMANKGCSQRRIKCMHHMKYVKPTSGVSGPWLICQISSDSMGKLLVITRNNM